MEVTNPASRGVANSALGIGIAGLSLGLLNGGLGNLLGGAGNCGCNEDHLVNRYEMGLVQENEALKSSIALRDANTFTMGEMGKLRDYVDGRFSGIEQQICAQNVYNATNTAAIGCINGQIAQLMSLTKLVVPNSSVCPGWTTTTTTTG